MLVRKWNDKLKKYEEPFELDTTLYTEDMDKLIECPVCHKRFKFGEGYSAGDYYDNSGVWRIPVCPDCAEEYFYIQGLIHRGE